ncbi:MULTISPECIES: dipeptide ABC transporter ATP-binding protein [Pseudonocardia]|uniref:Glutathione import ATP-binding protein GsiA n=2 Tax=Pseudonocardia TaxID=1847 RepID=A0A1Y2MUR8_PSEAH|nr:MULTISPECIES: ABC transporter ATP-binding protein [Pseudonocardia]OSY38368.1 Glutathione import ATP-binding protein GsiA [Pseudonocardia autotrophica]TDN72587.1 peptide/nickel transport system ATP-binding protein/peptide/nickel transport system ATP-binding protein [Pseudonocardia autotrophica]BBG03296.1 putative ABC transporter ATP-binding protein [Pseudonocardia autotrophica]GEC24554.1 putative ABC transporter ATP-binding protein [Pseudonocardia saturnea]
MSAPTTTTAIPALRLTDLHVRSGGRTLVHGVDLELAPGERLGLIGESGSGKSLTAYAALGLLDESLQATGTIALAGVDGNLLDAGEAALCRARGRTASMVFQEPMTALNPLMRVGAQIAEVLLEHRTVPGRAAAAAAAVELLEQVRMPDPEQAARAYPHQLSGGQRQRVVLAIAMANAPAVLVCDEPTTALDVTVQGQVLELITELARERGTALLFISHDLAVVASVTDRVAVMQNGRIVEQGPVDEVLTAPSHPYTRALLAAADLSVLDEHGRLRTTTSAPAASAAPLREVPVPPAGPQRPGGPAAHLVLPEDGPPPVFNAVEGTADGTGESTGDGAGEGAGEGRALIRARDLTRTYRRAGASVLRRSHPVHALRGVGFDVAEGQALGIVGESGSGKSTLIRQLCGLDRPTSGSLQLAGDDITDPDRATLRRVREAVSIVFQDPMGSLDPRMRVRDIVAEPVLRGDRAEIRDRVARLLESVGLDAAALDRYPHQFSGGQRQRIAIARALITRPRILVADEPVSALDVSVRAQVLNLIAGLAREYRLTVVLISHDLAVVRHVCDTVAVMNQGRIVEAGPTADVYASPLHPFTRRLVAATPRLRDALADRTKGDPA